MGLKNEHNTLIDRCTFSETCPACGLQFFRKLKEIRTINPESDIKVNLIECLTCYHWFINPTLPQLALNQLYKEQSSFVVPKSYVGTKESTAENKMATKITKNTILPCNYLELGIGSGLLYNAICKLNQSGQNIGIEPAPWYKDPNIFSSIEDVPIQNFDLAVAFDVIEHLENPLKMLRLIFEKLTPGGRFYCTFPNKDSFIAKIQKDAWAMIRPFGHLHFFSKSSLVKVFSSSGFKIVEARSMLPGDLSFFEMTKSIPINSHFPYAFLRKVFLGRDQWFIQAQKPPLSK